MILVIFLAPLYEWYAHKFILHRQLTDKNNWLRKFQIKLHHGHHADPEDIDLQFAPAIAIISLFIQTYIFYSIICFSFKTALVPIFSTFIYYLFYEWTHLAHHSMQYRPITRIGKSLKEAHMQHHFHNENYNWGITNALGDMILGTWKHLDEIPKSTTARHLDNFNPQNSNSGM